MKRGLWVFFILATLTGCSLWKSASQNKAPTPEVLTALPSPVSVEPSLPGQEQALLPDARADLASLENLTRYQIEVEIDPDGRSFSGSARVMLTNTEDEPLQELYFRLFPNGHKSYGNGSLAVSRVLVGENEADTSLSHADTALKVQLAESLEAGAGLELTLAFNGVIPLDYGGEDSGGYGIYNQTQGVTALSGWYPILAVYDEDGWHLDPVSYIGDSVFSETAFYNVDITAPNELRVAATGVEVASRTGERATTHRYISGPARDFFMVMSAEFQKISLDAGYVRLNAYTLPGQDSAGQVALQVAGDALEAYRQNFGPYPLTELDLVAAPMEYALGVEFPGIVLIASDLYEDPEAQSFIGTVAHEVAHQWWYNLVGNDVFAEPWLDESLATYATGLYYEHQGGEDAYQGYILYLQTRYASLVADGLDDVVTRPLSYFEGLENPRVYGSVAYSKGALFYHLLRKEIGDEAFFTGLRSYYQQHKYQVATTQDLLEAFRQATDVPLEELYQEYLYSAK